MVGLFHRERTGDGQRIDVNLFNTAIALQCQELAAFMNLPDRWERSEAGIGGAWLSAPFGIYRTADRHIAIAMASLPVLGELLGLPELAAYDDDRAYTERDDVYRIIQARLLDDGADHWLALLGSRDVWCAPVSTFEDVVDDPQVRHNELLTTVERPNGERTRVVGMPVRFSATPGEVRSGPPSVGQHTDEVLSSIGFSDEEIATMRSEGAI
jgi:crotonobetainyl-CoA:carnitine CoA-transferase CaiB-like acyl-CoA transferase